ncbi:MAG: hypothetical protein AMXMBFR74_32590 [Parvibaculum sp.]
MGHKYKQFTFEDRCEIARLRGEGRSMLEKVHRTFSFADANRLSPHRGRVVQMAGV